MYISSDVIREPNACNVELEPLISDLIYPYRELVILNVEPCYVKYALYGS
jgi:hypothetical protein